MGPPMTCVTRVAFHALKNDGDFSLLAINAPSSQNGHIANVTLSTQLIRD